jgi:hypothetical protein
MNFAARTAASSGGGTAQILRTVVARRILDRKLPQTRDGYLGDNRRRALE